MQCRCRSTGTRCRPLWAVRCRRRCKHHRDVGCHRSGSPECTRHAWRPHIRRHNRARADARTRTRADDTCRHADIHDEQHRSKTVPQSRDGAQCDAAHLHHTLDRPPLRESVPAEHTPVATLTMQLSCSTSPHSYAPTSTRQTTESTRVCDSQLTGRTPVVHSTARSTPVERHRWHAPGLRHRRWPLQAARHARQTIRCEKRQHARRHGG